MFSSIPSSLIQIGKSLKKELFDLIKGNLDDIQNRLVAVEGVQPLIEIFNEDILNASSSSSLTGLLYYKAQRNLRLVKAEIQVFELDSMVTYGSPLSIDIKKGSDLDALNSVFITLPTINLDFVSDYATDAGQIDPLNQDILADEFLRLDISTLPVNAPLGFFRVVLFGVAI